MTELALTNFEFTLPNDLIAQEPTNKRDESKLLHYDKQSKKIGHHSFSKLPSLLPNNAVLVFNNTKVIKARIIAHRKSGAKIECFFLERIQKNRWHTLLKKSNKINIGEILHIEDHQLKIIKKKEKTAIVEIIGKFNDFEFLEKFGKTPLPPYIKTDQPNQFTNRYQTIFASTPGAVAAPTASLHFTKDTFTQLKAKNIEIIYITLHIGLGTFNPIQSNNIYDHAMHKETYLISETAAIKLNKAKKEKKKIFAIGTTATRCLESNIKNDQFTPGKGETSLYITPKYKFKCIDGMVTNFHLPKSSLIILIASLIGKDTVLNLYNIAIKHRYRFFSFGDAMLIT